MGRVAAHRQEIHLLYSQRDSSDGAHVLPGQREEAAGTLDGLLFGDS